MTKAIRPGTSPLIEPIPPPPTTAIQAPSGTFYYEAPLRVVRGIASAQTTPDALKVLYTLLHKHYGLRALALEIVSGPVTHFQTYGNAQELNAVLQLPAPPNTLHLFACLLDDPMAPPGRITYLFPADSPATPELLEATTQQIALRLGQETLVRRAEDAEGKAWRRISEVAAIYEIGQAIDQIELPRLLQLITDRAALLMDAQACSLMLTDEDAGVLRVAAGHGLPEEAMAQEQTFGQGLAGRVAQTEQPLLITAGTVDPRLDGVTLRPEISSSMLVPMKSQDGSVLGVLSIRRNTPAGPFDEDDLKLFSVFATQAALAVTNKRLYDDLTRRANGLLKISKLSRVLISTLNLDALLERVVEEICTIVGFERCCLFLRDASRGMYVPCVWRGYPDTVGRNPVREGEGVVGMVGRNKTTITFDAREPAPPEQERERTYLQMKGFARSLGTDTFVAIPILTSQYKCVGVVVADNKGRRESISEEARNLLSSFIDQAGIAIDNARLYEASLSDRENIHRLKNYRDNVLQSIGAGIVSTDARGHIASWNRAAAETLRQPASYFRDAALTDVIARLCLPALEREHLLDMIRRVQESGERVHLPKLTLHPDNREPMTLDLMLSRLTDQNQERAGVVLVFEDVTQEARLEAEVERMRRLADIGQLAAKMAHEVRNALSPMKGAAQIIKVEMEAQNASTEWPDIVIAEVDSLSSLTSEMLDFARPTPLDPRPLRVETFLTGAVQALGSYLAEHRVPIEWQIAPDLPELHADPIQLGQVVRNIVLNAAQAMPAGGMLTIGAAYAPQTSLVTLWFQDTGIGIAREDQDRIFRPFVTTKPKGTGLGLPIVQKIVDHHGGRVELESQPGAGTCFRILLPLAPPPEMPEVLIDDPLISDRTESSFPDK